MRWIIICLLQDDHVQKKQPTLSLTGMVSNTPLDATALTETGRAVMAYEALLSMLGEEVTVATTVRLYPSMIVTTVGLPRSDPQSLNALSFRVEFRQIKKVAPVFVKFDPSILEDDDDDERAPADSGASETERGAQEESPTEEEEEQAQTVGVQGLDILFNAFGGGDFLGGA